MDSNIPSCGMGTTIEQGAYQKCLELHDFVPTPLPVKKQKKKKQRTPLF